MTDAIRLDGFAYGEHLEGLPPRSLGFRLLVPVESVPWAGEVETLARRLQAAPFPETWPPTDLFCSVLLEGGQRLIAVASYGLADHTLSRRRGGLELIGVVGPAGLGVPEALAVYQWLRQRRQATEDMRSLGGPVALADVLAAVPPPTVSREPVPVLPVRLWQEGVLLFAATSPSDPDHQLGLLEQGTGADWQWLPLVGPDMPLPVYAHRGPLIAWTPHLAGVAVKLDRPVERAAAPRRRPVLVGLLALVLAGLLGANLWAALDLRRDVLAILRQQPSSAPPPAPAASADPAAAARERLAQALYRVIQNTGGKPDWTPQQLLAQYERLALRDEELRLTTPEARQAVGAIGQLARQRPGRLEEEIRTALSNRGFDPELVELACKRVHEHLAGAAADQ